LNSLHESSSWLSIMFSRHDFLSKSNDLHVFSTWLKAFYQMIFMFLFMFFIMFLFMFLVMTFYQIFLSNSLHDFLSWLFSIAFLHDFSSWFFIKWSSCFLIITLYHDFLSWLLFMTFYHIVFMFLVMTLYQKDNAKAKNRKNFYI